MNGGIPRAAAHLPFSLLTLPQKNALLTPPSRRIPSEASPGSARRSAVALPRRRISGGFSSAAGALFRRSLPMLHAFRCCGALWLGRKTTSACLACGFPVTSLASPRTRITAAARLLSPNRRRVNPSRSGNLLGNEIFAGAWRSGVALHLFSGPITAASATWPASACSATISGYTPTSQAITPFSKH